MGVQMQFECVEGASTSDSPRGMLQRGRGLGWLVAAGNPVEGRTNLLACLARDPRLESQEYRSPYYASLAIQLEIDPIEIAALGTDDENGLVVATLVEMSDRGIAVPLSEGVLASFEFSESALSTPFPVDTPAASAIVGPRSALFASTELVERLVTTSEPSEIDSLHEAALAGAGMPYRLAMELLGLRGDLVVFDLAEQALASRGLLHAGGMAYFRNLPGSISLPFARKWIDLHDHRWSAAAMILRSHAVESDLSSIRRQLSSIRDWDMMYLISALGRFPQLGTFPELKTILEETCFPFLRGEAAKAMAATDSEFPRVFGVECLWDCDPEVRLQGVQSAPASPDVATRLNELALDEHEQKSVRDAARLRLDLLDPY